MFTRLYGYWNALQHYYNYTFFHLYGYQLFLVDYCAAKDDFIALLNLQLGYNNKFLVAFGSSLDRKLCHNH